MVSGICADWYNIMVMAVVEMYHLFVAVNLLQCYTVLLQDAYYLTLRPYYRMHIPLFCPPQTEGNVLTTIKR